MFEQHEREEIRRMEMDKLRRTIANQDAVICEMKGMLIKARQAQHEATWAMAMEEARTAVRLGVPINAIPCPPLTTNGERG